MIPPIGLGIAEIVQIGTMLGAVILVVFVAIGREAPAQFAAFHENGTRRLRRVSHQFRVQRLGMILEVLLLRFGQFAFLSISPLSDCYHFVLILFLSCSWTQVLLEARWNQHFIL